MNKKLIPKYQDGDLIHTAKPSQYDFQVTAESPIVYWDGFNWIGFNDLGQRVTKGPNFNPSGARIIENPQEFENARLAQARRKDINGTHRFAEKVRGVATLAAMAPMAGPLVEAATTVAPTAMPWIKGAMELGVRPTSTIARGLSSYIPQVSKAIPYFTGLDKTAMGMTGLFGMKDAYEGYKSGDKHWTNALAEGALSGMMATELAPAVKYANEFAGRGFNFLNSPLTSKWTTFGNKQYRFKPGYLGMNGAFIESRATNQQLTITADDVTRFYHGSPVRFDTFDASFIGSGEGGSKVMKGINLWPKEKIGNAPKFANIKSSDAPLHLGRSSTPLGGELNPTVYDVSGKGLKLYKATPREIKSLNQEDLIKQDYDGVQTPSQVTVFPESISKLSIDKQSSIEDFVMSHPEVERWTPWTTDDQKMQNIIDMSRMSKWAPEQWTAAQDAAIAKGDIVEAQRLRDLHFKVSAPNNTIVDNEGMPSHVYHGTESKPFTVFDINVPRVHDLGTYGKGFYFTPNKETATNYGNGKFVFDSYLKLEKPYSGNMDVVDNVGNFKNLKELKNYYKQKGIPEKELNTINWGNFDVTDGVNAGDEIMVLRPNQIKLANAVTFDDNNVRIPLGERDNFNINDIRYGLVPWLIGGTTAGYLYNNKQ